MKVIPITLSDSKNKVFRNSKGQTCPRTLWATLRPRVIYKNKAKNRALVQNATWATKVKALKLVTSFDNLIYLSEANLPFPPLGLIRFFEAHCLKLGKSTALTYIWHHTWTICHKQEIQSLLCSEGSKEHQGPRKDGCHGCLVPATFCGMGATGARFQQFFLIFSSKFAK